MKQKINLYGTILGVLVLFACAQLTARAQMNPLTVKLTKKVSFDPRTEVRYSTGPYGGGYDSYGTSRTVTHTRNPAHYSIEVLNNTIRKYDEVKVKWSALVKAANSKEETLEEGEQTSSLEARKKLAYDVSAKDSRSDVVACSVEVFISDSLVASDTEPESAKDKIAKLKGKSE
jgi:hypothetical protein